MGYYLQIVLFEDLVQEAYGDNVKPTYIKTLIDVFRNT